MLLTDLPVEILETIVGLCDPLDVAGIAQTTQQFRSLIYTTTDDTLWRNLYLAQPLDDPRKCLNFTGEKRSDINWKEELQCFIRARTVLRQMSLGKAGELGSILQTLISLVSHTPPKPHADPDSAFSKNLVTAQALLCTGWIDVVEESTDSTSLANLECQLINRLHTYYGLTSNDIKVQTRAKMKGFVYNMQNYTFDTGFGPWDSEGNVNWVHLNALRNAVSMQLLFNNFGDEDILGEDRTIKYNLYPLSLPYIQSILPPDREDSSQDGGGSPTDAVAQDRDWAGVEGEWIVAFCFCDHRELLVFNDDITAPGFPEDVSLFEGESGDHFHEVFRLMNVDLKVTGTAFDAASPSKGKISFVGVMKEHQDSTIHGTVTMSKEGYVHWHFYSGDGNEDIWESDGVQVGGLRSEYGVLGCWTTRFHEPDDPVGESAVIQPESGAKLTIANHARSILATQSAKE
ncbi:hypothetical protein BKA70DRAFT_1184121 [Coprinopsis sp. MPI-PUGE-AT-0042]|nr:hypothetical protein BKA70DRAFT_1184121 [Coprinopsis sp. MPI-PUGE-AT-0042]